VLPYVFGASLTAGPLVVKLLNIVIEAALALGLFLWAWRRGRAPQDLLAGALIAVDGSTAIWGMAGFETTLQALLVTAALLPFLEEGDGGRARCGRRLRRSCGRTPS
jgi:hypothetical protein